jgi:RNA polymerase sigma-70 factor (ECF subfamily)
MWRIAVRILGRPDLAADAVQEALISVHAIPEAPRNLEAWLLRAVTLRSIAARRAQLRRLRNEAAAADGAARSAVPLDPEHELLRKELAARITAALRVLPAEQREAFLLREFHGFDYEQISSTQRVPVGTVRSRLSRARRSLRDRLGRPLPVIAERARVLPPLEHEENAI